MSSKKLSIALIGTRGVPANYGGFETCVHEISQRLVERGHNVTVYCRRSYYEDRAPEWKGVHRIFLPNLHRKSLDTLSHTFLSVWHALFCRYDIYMVFNAANSPFLLLLRMLGKRIAINTDGLEWKRSKWNYLGRTYYKFSEKVACILSNRIVADSKGIAEYYKDNYNIDSSQIAYGAYINKNSFNDNLCKLGLKKGEYFLQITRFEPENYPLLTIKAFKKLNTNKKLVLVGGNQYGGSYLETIKNECNENIILAGFIYEHELLNSIWSSCYAYIHGNSVGGTNPALLQTMASGCFTMAIDVPFNRDVLQDCGLYFKPDEDSLYLTMKWSLENENELESYKNKAQNRILQEYTWEKIALQYEQLFYELFEGKYPWHFSGATCFKTK